MVLDEARHEITRKAEIAQPECAEGNGFSIQRGDRGFLFG